MTYRVVAFGVDVEFTKDKKAAFAAFKDTRGASIWEIAEGHAKLLGRNGL
jgi:hypothetical protein